MGLVAWVYKQSLRNSSVKFRLCLLGLKIAAQPTNAQRPSKKLLGQPACF